MYAAYDFLSDVNPWALAPDETDIGEGELLRGGAIVPVDQERVLISFQNGPEPLELVAFNIDSSWTGSPGGRLFIRASGALVSEYFVQYTSDSEPGDFSQRVAAIIPPHRLLEISFLSDTDTVNDRPMTIYASGFYRRKEAR